MDHEPPNQFDRRRQAPTMARRGYELAERSSNGTQVRLLWQRRTKQLWVEVREPDDQVFVIQVRSELALDAFHHPYAYAGLRGLLPPAESLAACESRSQQVPKECREP